MNAEHERRERDITALRDAELIDFVRDTVSQLNELADRLEVYAKDQVAQGEPNVRGE